MALLRAELDDEAELALGDWYSGGGAKTTAGDGAGKTPVVLSVVGAIFAIVRCSAEEVEELRLKLGRDDREDEPEERLERISRTESESSESESELCCSGGSSTEMHCSTKVLNEI